MLCENLPYFNFDVSSIFGRQRFNLLSLWVNSLSMTIQMKAAEFYYCSAVGVVL